MNPGQLSPSQCSVRRVTFYSPSSYLLTPLIIRFKNTDSYAEERPQGQIVLASNCLCHDSPNDSGQSPSPCLSLVFSSVKRVGLDFIGTSTKFYLICRLQLDSVCSLACDAGDAQEAGFGLRGKVFHAGSARSAVDVDCGGRGFPSCSEILGGKKCDSLLLHSSFSFMGFSQAKPIEIGPTCLC